MIEVIDSVPDFTAGFYAAGRVTSQQYERVVAPTLADKFDHFEQINVLYDLGDDLDVYDFRTFWVSSMEGWRNYNRWNHIAVVTDKFWIQNSLKFWSFFTPKHTRIFFQEEKEAALEWVKVH